MNPILHALYAKPIDIECVIRRVIKPTTKAVFDAMNGIVFRDDKQIVNQLVTKRYSDNQRIDARVYEVSFDG